jgi:hypothetical protein
LKLSIFERLVLAVTATAALVLFSVAVILDARSELHLQIVRSEKPK